MNFPNQIHQIFSWRLMSEMMRRFQNQYHLIEMHPGGGMYDSLALIEIIYLEIKQIKFEK